MPINIYHFNHITNSFTIDAIIVMPIQIRANTANESGLLF